MRYVCDAPGRKTWFGLETEAEAMRESEAMQHAVEKFYLQARERAAATYKPASTVFFEQSIGLEAHIQREMPLFLTLRDDAGTALATAMLPSRGRHDPTFRIIIVGPGNVDPYPQQGQAIEALGEHFGLTLERSRCYPYRRG